MPGVWVQPKNQTEYNALMKIYENSANITKDGCCGKHEGWEWGNGLKATKLNVYDGDTFIQAKDRFEQANKKDLTAYSACDCREEYTQKVISFEEFLDAQNIKLKR